MKPVNKAWCVDWSKISEGAYYSGNIEPVYAETRGQAKKLFLPDIQEYELRFSTEPITFLNIPIRRCKELDKFDFDGDILTKYEYEENKIKIERENKLKNILSDDNISHCYILKRGSFYADNYCGYTQYISKAGVYKKSDAVSCANSCNELDIIPINNKEHNDLINNEIENLKNRLII